MSRESLKSDSKDRVHTSPKEDKILQSFHDFYIFHEIFKDLSQHHMYGIAYDKYITTRKHFLIFCISELEKVLTIHELRYTITTQCIPVFQKSSGPYCSKGEIYCETYKNFP